MVWNLPLSKRGSSQDTLFTGWSLEKQTQKEWWLVKRPALRLGLAFFGFTLIGAQSGAIGVLIPDLSSFYHVSDAVIGSLFFVSSIGYFISAFTSSLLLERLGLRRFMLIGICMFFAGTLVFGLKPPFAVLLLMRLFLGLGLAIIETGFNAYVVAQPRHTSQMNTLHAFYGMGALLGPLVGAAFVATSWGWSGVFLLWTVLGIPLLLGVAAVYSRQIAQPSASNEGEEVGGNILVKAIRLPVVWWAAIFLLLYVGVEVSLGNWSYTLLIDWQHQQTWLASWMVSGYWLGLTLGRFTLTRIAERLRVNTINLIYICMGGTILGVLIVWLLPSTLFAALGLLLIGFCLGPIYPTTVAVLPTLVPRHLVSSAIALLVSISILGIAIFPWLAGVLAQGIGIWSLLPYIIALTALMILSWGILFYSVAKA